MGGVAMMIDYSVRIAGFVLLAIGAANFFAFKKLGWNRNLERTETFFRQVFCVHTVFIVFTLLAMAAVCLLATDELVAKSSFITSGLIWFMAIFWVVRIMVQLFYYGPAVARKNPWWNALFTFAFLYLGGVFSLLAVL